MTVKDLYNILEKEVDSGRLTLDSEIYSAYECICYGEINSYDIEDNVLYLRE